MRFVLLIATMIYLGLGGAAFACAGDQTGTVVLEDQFTDDSGGWDLTGAAKVEPPSLVITVDPAFVSRASLNQTFNATDGDYCVDVTLPANPPANKPVAGGLVFWASDYENYYLFQVSSNTSVGLWRLVGNRWSPIFKLADPQLVKTSGANNLRVVIKDGSIVLSVNGKEIKKVRAQTPPGSLRFGLRAERTEGTPVPGPLSVKFENFKLTSGN